MSKNSVLEELILHEVCIDFTKFVVNSSNHDGMSKGSAIILDFWISRWVVAGEVEDPVIPVVT